MTSRRTVRTTIALLVLVSGCLYPSLPRDPLPRPDASSTASNTWLPFSSKPSCQLTEGASGYNQPSVTADYRCGMDYGRQAYDTYRSFLVQDACISNGFGYLMFAAGGAALGMAAAGTSVDSTLATAELGVGGGTLMGAVIWGRNKPKLSAYAAGAVAVRCVLGQAGQLAPGIAKYDEIEKGRDSLNAALGKLQDKLSTDSLDSQISTQESTVEQLQANHRADAEEELSKLKNTKTAADNAIAEAKTQLSNANVIIGLDEDAGRSIVEQIQAIDAQVFDAAYKGEPDFASISTQAKPSLPFFGQNAKLPTGGQGPSVRTYASPINDVIDATNSLKKSLGGLTIERPNFKQCITSLGEAIAQVQKAQQATPTPTASATPTATATRTATPTPTKTPQPQHRKEKKGPKG